jgi:urease accessory protein
MLRIDRVIGDRADPVLRDRLHELEHHGAVEIVKLSISDLDRHRLRARTERGEEIAITLPRDEKLFDGAVIHLADMRAIVVRAGEQRWMRLSPQSISDAIELGYCAGNLHWRVRFDKNDILIALEGPVASYISRIEHFVQNGRASWSEESE